MRKYVSSLIIALFLSSSLFAFANVKPVNSMDEHDIAVTRVVTDYLVAWKGCPVNIWTTVVNQGTYDETFNLTIYANSTALKEIDNIHLASGTNTTITVSWDGYSANLESINVILPPFIPPKYVISAYATPVQNETDITNNSYVGNTVTITIPYDANGDGKISVLDLILVAIRLGKVPPFGLPYPIPYRIDFNGDNKVNVLDLILVSRALEIPITPQNSPF